MKKLVTIIFVALFILAIPLTVYLVLKNQELRKKAAPATTLKLVPQNVNKEVGDLFTLEVKIDTAENDVIAAEINIVYDATKLEATTISNGALFPNIIESGTIGEGIASISVGAANAATPIRGAGTAATISFKALAATTSPISVRFDPNTFVGALGEESANVLVSSIPATVTIQGDAIEDEPSPTPTTTPLLTQTVQPTPTTTLAVTPSPTPTTSPGAVTITTPTTNTSVATSQPTFEGTAPAGATVTLTIYSDPITTTVTADAAGNWSYNSVDELSDGPHTIVASATDPVSGQTKTSTVAFVVAAGQTTEDNQEDSVVPVSGTREMMYTLLIIGIVLIMVGIVTSPKKETELL